MSVKHSARSEGIIGISSRFCLTWIYVSGVCSQWNRLTEAIRMITHNIPFLIGEESHP